MTRLIDMPDGLHEGIPPEKYHERALDLASKGGLEELEQSPLHFKTWVEGGPDKVTPALAFGQAFHVALLEPERFALTYAAEPEWGDLKMVEGRTTKEEGKENKNRRDAWREANAGKTALDVADDSAIGGMIQSVHAHPLARRMITNGVAELTALWRDPASGVRCKGRADYYVRKLGMILDVKTCEDASLDGFSRAVFKYGYDLQAALYCEGFTTVGAPVHEFCFVAVEKEPPYAVGVYRLDARGWQRGQARMRRLLDLQARCLREDDWPAYSEHIETIQTPNWAA